MILEAVEMLAQGADADAILARWAEIRDGISITFYLELAEICPYERSSRCAAK